MRRSRESPKLLLTTSEVLDALGHQPVCELTGARYKVVHGWRGSETFPSRYFLVMTWALKQKRLSAPPALWGMVTTAQMEKAAA